MLIVFLLRSNLRLDFGCLFYSQVGKYPAACCGYNSLGKTKNRRLRNSRNTPELAPIGMQSKPDIIVWLCRIRHYWCSICCDYSEFQAIFFILIQVMRRPCCLRGPEVFRIFLLLHCLILRHRLATYSGGCRMPVAFL